MKFRYNSFYEMGLVTDLERRHSGGIAKGEKTIN